VSEQDYGGLEIKKPVERPMPIGRAEAMGTIRPDDLHIFMPERVLKEIIVYSRSRTDVEVGGVVVGTLCAWRGVPYLDIQGYLIARKAIHSPASLRFTHDTWAAIHKEKDERFPGDESIILGWHHTHPGYTVFLSATDMFTHRNYFNLPWLVALVVDPKADQLGFFQWKGDLVVPVGFYFTR
jgi:proteasome lid subunit RPN8/RPN11